MPFILLFIGIIIVLVGANGTYAKLGQQLTADFTGPNNFLNWIAAIGLVGAVGYVPQLQKFSRVFLGLILLAVFFSGSKQGFWQKLQDALGAIAAGSGTPSAPTATNPDLSVTGGSTPASPGMFGQTTPLVTAPFGLGTIDPRFTGGGLFGIGGQGAIPGAATQPLGGGSTTGPQLAPYGGL